MPNKVKKMINTIKQALENSFSYADYRKKVTNLIAEGKSKLHDVKNDGESLLAEGKSRFYDVKNEINNPNI